MRFLFAQPTPELEEQGATVTLECKLDPAAVRSVPGLEAALKALAEVLLEQSAAKERSPRRRLIGVEFTLVDFHFITAVKSRVAARGVAS